MSNNVSFFAVHADDVSRASAFYSAVFGWRFTAWGPPGFFLIETGSAEKRGIGGALEKRQEPRSPGGVNAFECSIAVDDIQATARLVAQHGATIIMPPVTIPTVGTLIKFHDTEGNLVTAIQYDAGHK